MSASADPTKAKTADGQARAVFLDRDGVLNVDTGYAHRVEDLALVPGAGDALAELKRRGYLLVVVTNQSGVGRGMYTLADVEKFHAAMQMALADRYGVLIDAFYSCCDHPDRATDRRKPGPGMVLEAARDFGIDLARSVLVGDRASDVACAVAAGVRGIQIVSPGEAAHPQAYGTAASLQDAVRLIDP